MSYLLPIETRQDTVDLIKATLYDLYGNVYVDEQDSDPMYLRLRCQERRIHANPEYVHGIIRGIMIGSGEETKWVLRT
jgi:hypothetical protein